MATTIDLRYNISVMKSIDQFFGLGLMLLAAYFYLTNNFASYSNPCIIITRWFFADASAFEKHWYMSNN